ncbi:hypothetical protein BBH99_00585 [Chryseobacterium contaminans]|uniref:DUF4369 domain-containing protein n=1 Tax=Chryseobacterium contaminans TaxID=1423959 RepID=A0A1M6VT48_9FLAO|nr:hypothetical protein [Chryseobacterium contaminans]OCA80629.1 hypothetical protein BBH99_00585 [Chryseobacterium contaminans]SHK84554.1 hypothetical protein SAMN05444407_101352 [Chryseobacterium contaminans]
MKYLFQHKRMFFILLFLFSGVKAQKLTVINNTGKPIIIKNGKKDITLNNRDKKEFTETNTITINIPNELIQNMALFLEPTEKLNLSIEKDNKFVYTGDQAERHEYLTQQLAIETFGKINTYEQIGQKKNISELKNTSELLLVDILKKIKLSNITVSPEDKISIKRLKNYIKYNWLYTLFTTIDHHDKNFKKEVLNYYYKKYIETDIPKFSCTASLHYKVIEILAKNRSLLSMELPTYPIVEHTDDDAINQYLPQNCQKQYFWQKYNYLEHINGHNKEYYKKVLREKFNEE